MGYFSPTYSRLRELASEKNEKWMKKSTQLHAIFNITHKRKINCSEWMYQAE